MTNCCNEYGRCTQGPNCPVREKYAAEGSEYLLQPAKGICLKPGPTRATDGVEITEWHAPETGDVPAIVMLDKPYQWLRDLFFSAVWWAGTISLTALTACAFLLATGFFPGF